MRFLIYGYTGWIGQMVVKLLLKYGDDVIKGTARLENYQDVLEEIKFVKPNRVMNLAGITGKPNSDWCEDHQEETIKVNLTGVVNLAKACHRMEVHLTNYSTGCMYTSTEPKTEEDEPNFDASFYSKIKIEAEKALRAYPDVLTLRIRIPVSDDDHEKNLINKLSKFKKIVNKPNSITVLPSLLPISINMSIRHITGVFNFVNSGVIFHSEILEMYKSISTLILSGKW